MIRKLVSYEVRKEALPQALVAVRAFVDEVERKEGGTAAYRAFQHVDRPTRFTHYMEFRTPSAEQYHDKTQWSKRFLDALRPLCVAEPTAIQVALVEKT